MAEPKFYIKYWKGDSQEDILAQLDDSESSSPEGNSCLILIGDSPDHLQKLVEKAKKLLKGEIKNFLLVPDIYFASKPISGEVAFVFTGSTTSYPNMGKELVHLFPELIEVFREKAEATDSVMELIYEKELRNSTMFDELRTSSFICQLHAMIAKEFLYLQPDAVLGYCSGESNALMAMGIWRDLEALYNDVYDSEMYTKKLSGEHQILKEAWPELSEEEEIWGSYRVYTPVDKIKSSLTSYPHIHIAIINTDHDFILSGYPPECEKFLQEHNLTEMSKKIPYSMLIHCPEFKSYSDEWYRIHYRKTDPLPISSRIYSAGMGRAYEPSSKNAALSLLEQANKQVNWPHVVNQAREDGVRVFIEMGPRDLCTQWIRQNLKGKESVCFSFDQHHQKSDKQFLRVLAQLIVLKVFPSIKPYHPLLERLNAEIVT